MRVRFIFATVSGHIWDVELRRLTYREVGTAPLANVCPQAHSIITDDEIFLDIRVL